MTENVLHVDFGREVREHSRRLSRLVGLVEDQEQELLTDPRRLFDMACEAIALRDQVIRDAQDALRQKIQFEYNPGPISFEPFRTVHVPADEYERMKKAAEIIGRGVVKPQA